MEPTVEPLVVWGDYDQDALHVRSAADLGLVLDGLHAMAATEPVSLRLWSVVDDQVFAVINGNHCALYVVTSGEGYGTSVGDPTRDGTFEIALRHLGRVNVSWSDLVPWRLAREALLSFADTGLLGNQVMLDDHIPSQLLALGDLDRASELETRRPPATDPAQTSIAQKSPHASWAERLLGGLVELHLIEIDPSITDVITARLAVMLVQCGEDALDSPESAQRFTTDLSRLRGVGALFATAGDLQIALRRTQDPPTMPVEMPL